MTLRYDQHEAFNVAILTLLDTHPAKRWRHRWRRYWHKGTITMNIELMNVPWLAHEAWMQGVPKEAIDHVQLLLFDSIIWPVQGLQPDRPGTQP